MDIVLEILDTFVGDRFYAFVLPAFTSSSQDELYTSVAADATSTSLRAFPTPFKYQPATQFLYLEPSQFAYQSQWPRDHIYRQYLSLFAITWFFGFVLYFVFSSLSYIFIFDKTAVHHPKFLKNQMRLEIHQALSSMPGMAALTALCFVGEVQGYSKMYDHPSEAPFWAYNYLQFPFFILFTDLGIYWIHRGLHHPLIYKTLHKPHHKWIMPTPYASHAFHPIDGFAQSVPYHLFPFIFPLNKFAYIILFVFINCWTILIHDGEYVANSPVINGAACHTMHHLYFNYNYGQFTTLWDRLGGSYRKPNEELFRRETKMGKEEWERQAKEMEKLVKEVEGDDDRTYDGDVKKTQ